LANASTLPAPIQAVRRLAGRRTAPELPSAVSFPELVWAHFIRQREVHETGSLNGEADEEFRRRLAAFEASEGRLVNAYWCTCEASAVALTARRRGFFSHLFRQSPEIRFHAATDWVTRDSPEIANTLHTCETLSVRASEILRGPTERIAMQWILATAGHMLGFVDQKEGKRTRADTARLVRRKRSELEKIEAYYHRAGEKVGRLVYFTGMLLGLALVAAIAIAAGVLVDQFGMLMLSAETTQNLIVSFGMGAVGALMSVMTRMSSSKQGVFTVDFEVGRGPLRSLGAFRPFIGATSALVIFFGIQSDLFQILPQGQQESKSIYYFAVVAFIAGFSERWVNVIFGRAQRVLDADEPKPVPDERSPSV
jgi:hypothetical protein